jgi:chromate transporter
MQRPADGSWFSVFVAFLRLGCTSFGGPVAHLGYLRREFVERRGWLAAEPFGQLLAVCQVLPGPASSQLGFGIGLLRAGWWGGLAAFVGFTLPSLLLLLAAGRVLASLEASTAARLVHGLALVAVAVVAQAVWQLARALAPDGTRRAIAAGALLLVVAWGDAFAQVGALVLGALVGRWRCGDHPAPRGAALAVPVSPQLATGLLSAVLGVLAAALLWPGGATATLGAIAAAFVRAGALVFGGGHVVLPLLERALVGPGWLDADTFLGAYGAAQAMPGPLFAVAAPLGAAVVPAGMPSLLGAGVATIALFAPGLLLLAAVLPAWARLRALPSAGPVLAGINAAVVGVLAAALVDPIAGHALVTWVDVAVAATGAIFLIGSGRSPLWVVGWSLLAALVLPR